MHLLRNRLDQALQRSEVMAAAPLSLPIHQMPGLNSVMRKAPKGGELDEHDKKINRIIAKVRARVEHPFRILKRQFGHVKTRYRSLAKNRTHLFRLLALGNLFLVRRRLLARGRVCLKSPYPLLRRLKQRKNHWKRCLSGPIVPSSGNVGAAEDVDQTFLRLQCELHRAQGATAIMVIRLFIFISGIVAFANYSTASAQILNQSILDETSSQVAAVKERVQQEMPILASAAEASVYFESSRCMALAVRLDLQDYTLEINEDFLSSIHQYYSTLNNESDFDTIISAREVVIWWSVFSYQIERASSYRIDEARAEWDLNCVGRKFILFQPPYETVTIARNARTASGPRDSFAVADPARSSIRILGEVTDGYAERISNAIEQFPDAKYISLGSAGGNVGEAIDAARVIRAAGLSTELSDTCESACALVFLGGVDRKVWSPAPDIGFHMLSLDGVNALEVDHALYDEISSFVYEMGANGSAYIDLMRMETPPEFFYPQVEVLCKANIVTWAQRRCNGETNFTSTQRRSDEYSCSRNGSLVVVNVNEFVNIRTGPSLMHPIVTRANLGERLTSIDRHDWWYLEDSRGRQCSSICERVEGNAALRQAMTSCVEDAQIWQQVRNSRRQEGFVSVRFLASVE